MEKLQVDIDKHQTTLMEPNLFTADPAKFEKAVQDLDKAQTDLAAAEERWIELEMLREQVEGS